MHLLLIPAIKNQIFVSERAISVRRFALCLSCKNRPGFFTGFTCSNGTRFYQAHRIEPVNSGTPGEQYNTGNKRGWFVNGIPELPD